MSPAENGILRGGGRADTGVRPNGNCYPDFALPASHPTTAILK
jgi:hypothetical protein